MTLPLSADLSLDLSEGYIFNNEAIASSISDRVLMVEYPG